MTGRWPTGGDFRRVVVVRAHAKINLSLRVLGRRPDGYHELRTVFQSLALHDTIRLAPTDGPLAIVCDDPSVPCDSRNLAVRAAALLWQAAGGGGDPAGVSIAITKRIPAQGGLGGGSSDGAAALVGLAELWGVELPPPALAELARQLGADVPFFLVGGTALGIGRGDEILPLEDRAGGWVTLAMPGFGVSTPEAFGWLDQARAGRDEIVRDSSAGSGCNDLEGPVSARHPEISALVAELRRAGADPTAMSGSGSTVFGLFGSSRRARSARLRLERLGRRALVTRTLARAEYEASACPRSAPMRPARRQLVGSRASRIH